MLYRYSLTIDYMKVVGMTWRMGTMNPQLARILRKTFHRLMTEKFVSS